MAEWNRAGEGLFVKPGIHHQIKSLLPEIRKADSMNTIPQAFEKLRSNLEISGLQKETVSTRQQAVRGVIEAGLDVLDWIAAEARATMSTPADPITTIRSLTFPVILQPL